MGLEFILWKEVRATLAQRAPVPRALWPELVQQSREHTASSAAKSTVGFAWGCVGWFRDISTFDESWLMLWNKGLLHFYFFHVSGKVYTGLLRRFLACNSQTRVSSQLLPLTSAPVWSACNKRWLQPKRKRFFFPNLAMEARVWRRKSYQTEQHSQSLDERRNMETDLQGHTKSLAQDTGSLGQGKGSHGMLSQWKREGPVYYRTSQGQKRHAGLERLHSSGSKSWTSQTDPRPPRRIWPPAQRNSRMVRKLRQGNELSLYYFFLLSIMVYSWSTWACLC